MSWWVSTQMTILNMPFHMRCANVLESSKYGDEFVGISYSSKYSKYFKGLPKDMRLSEYDFANYSTKVFSRLYPAYKLFFCLPEIDNSKF